MQHNTYQKQVVKSRQFNNRTHDTTFTDFKESQSNFKGHSIPKRWQPIMVIYVTIMPKQNRIKPSQTVPVSFGYGRALHHH